MSEYNHLPKSVQPPAIIVKALELRDDPNPPDLTQQVIVSENAIQNGLTALGASREEKAFAHHCLAVAQTNLDPIKELYTADPDLFFVKCATHLLALEFYQDNPHLLRAERLSQNQNPITLALASSHFLHTAILPHFMPPLSPANSRAPYRVLPAPAIFAALGQANAIRLQTETPNPISAEGHTLLVGVANAWLAIGAQLVAPALAVPGFPAAA